MNSRERLLTALAHGEPDRVPIDLGATDVTSIHRDAYIELMAHLGRDPGSMTIDNLVQQLPKLDETFLQEIVKADVRAVKENMGSAGPLRIEERDGYCCTVNEWGIGMRMPKDGGLYFDLVDFPIKESTLKALDAYTWPSPADPSRWVGVAERARHLYETTPYGLVTTWATGMGVFQLSQFLRGMEDFFMDLASNPGFATRLMGKLGEVMSEWYSILLDQVGPYVQVVRIADDLAGQQGPLISPVLYRKLVKPIQKKVIAAIKAKANVYVMYHSDGAMLSFLPDLIDIGVDIFNPVQVNARGMGDTLWLKQEFGRDLSFWGGLCDNQFTLPFGTPQDVRSETRRRLEDLMPGGGFVAAPIHNIQAGVPAENIVAMLETVHTYGIY
ncbi:MAG: uroporphyrinogen decarboxylase family protein [Anaerolineales bacterium]|nr:uroporphyrinogen decarboxylase family protein [Anaerolineales bacterium]